MHFYYSGGREDFLTAPPVISITLPASDGMSCAGSNEALRVSVGPKIRRWTGCQRRSAIALRQMRWLDGQLKWGKESAAKLYKTGMLKIIWQDFEVRTCRFELSRAGGRSPRVLASQDCVGNFGSRGLARDF